MPAVSDMSNGTVSVKSVVALLLVILAIASLFVGIHFLVYQGSELHLFFNRLGELAFFGWLPTLVLAAIYAALGPSESLPPSSVLPTFAAAVVNTLIFLLLPGGPLVGVPLSLLLFWLAIRTEISGGVWRTAFQFFLVALGASLLLLTVTTGHLGIALLFPASWGIIAIVWAVRARRPNARTISSDG